MWVISVRVSAVATVSWSDALCGEDVLWGVSRSRCWQASCFSVLYTATTWPWIIEAKSIATISTLIPAKGRQRKSSCEGNGLHSVWHDLRIRIWGKCKWWCSYCRLWRSLCLCDLPPGTCWGRGREHCSTVKGWQGKTWHQLTAWAVGNSVAMVTQLGAKWQQQHWHDDSVKFCHHGDKRRMEKTVVKERAD